MHINNCKFAKDSSIRATSLRVKFNNAWEFNHWKPLFALISVRILLKQLDFALNIYEAIVDSAFGLINYHLIEISSL